MGKAGVHGIDSFYYVKGTVKSNSMAQVADLQLHLIYSDTALYRKFTIHQIDSNGFFNVRDSFQYYDKRYGILTLEVVGINDSVLTKTILSIDSAKYFEISGEPTGCSSRDNPTTEVYTFPDQTIQIP